MLLSILSWNKLEILSISNKKIVILRMEVKVINKIGNRVPKSI